MYEFLEHDPGSLCEISAHEDAARGRRRPQQKSVAQQQREIKAAQNASGKRIRIWRKVLNEDAFGPGLRVLQKPHASRVLERKGYRHFTLTVLDTSQQTLRYIPDDSQEELEDRLSIRFPHLFKPTGAIAISGLCRVGGGSNPWIALGFRSESLDSSRDQVKEIIAPELMLDDRLQKDFRPHVSLAKLLVEDKAQRERLSLEIEADLAPVIPRFVELGPIRIDVDHGQTN